MKINAVENIEELCKQTDQILWQAYKRDVRNLLNQEQNTELTNQYGVSFPSYSSQNKNLLRVSEQEARQAFIQILTKEKLLYSVETPTKYKYRFSGSGKRLCSANTDLTVYYPSKNKVLNVEFKANGISPKAKNILRIDKDIRKIFIESPDALWFHILKNNNQKTINSILQTMMNAIKNLEQQANTDQPIKPKKMLIHICVLEAGFSIHKTFSIKSQQRNYPLINEEELKTYQDKDSKAFRQILPENGWRIFKYNGE